MVSTADIGLLSVHRGSVNGHREQFRGFALMGEKTDLRFLAGFHALASLHEVK